MIIKSFELLKNLPRLMKYNFFLLYGENEGLKKEIRESIKISLKQQGSNNIELLSLYENDLTGKEENFNNFIFSGSLFSDKKIVIINNGSDKLIDQIKRIVDKCPEDIFLIIYANILEKKSKLRNFFETNTKTLCVPCYPDNDRDLEIIAKKELGKNSIVLSKESINLLIEKSNGDRSHLRNEIEKIESFAQNKKNLDVDDIKSIINFSGEYKSNSLINECLSGNIPKYKKILTELYSSSPNQIFFFRSLNNKIQRLLAMKEVENDYKNIDALLNASKPPIFWKEKFDVKKQLIIWNINDLKITLNEVTDIEILCKKNPQTSKTIFFNFFSRLCEKASSFS